MSLGEETNYVMHRK